MWEMSDPLAMKVALSDDVLVQEVSGESVLLDLGSETYFGLNESGTRFWQLLTEYGNAELAIATMLEEYEVDEKTLRDDMRQLIQGLSEAGLITLTSRAEEDSSP